MIQPTATQQNYSRAYKILWALFLVAIVVYSAVPIRNALHGSAKDYGKWYRTGQVALSGGDIYDKGGGQTFQFMYPPTAAVLLAPVSAFGLIPLIVLLGLINSAAWIASVLLSVYLATGKMFRQHPLLYLIPAACTAAYVWNIYLLGQVNLLLLACMLGAFACLRLKRDWASGALIAFAAGIKAFPILALVYLVWRRHWKATAFTLVFLVFFLVLLPAPFRGFQRNLADLKMWNQGMALHYEEDSIAQRAARGYSWKNQSLLAVANRLLRPVDADGQKNSSLYVNILDMPFKCVNVVIVLVALGLCLYYVMSMPRHSQRTIQSDAIEFAMLLLLMLMFTPLSFTYFYVWLLFPLTVALQLVLTAPEGSKPRTMAVVWFVSCVLLMSFMLPVPFFHSLQAIGNTFFACVVLLVGLGSKLRLSKMGPMQPQNVLQNS